MDNTRKVRVVRAFYHQRKLHKVGETVELPALFALEVIASQKAEAVGHEHHEEREDQHEDKGHDKGHAKK